MADRQSVVYLWVQPSRERATNIISSERRDSRILRTLLSTVQSRLSYHGTTNLFKSYILSKTHLSKTKTITATKYVWKKKKHRKIIIHRNQQRCARQYCYYLISVIVMLSGPLRYHAHLRSKHHRFVITRSS